MFDVDTLTFLGADDLWAGLSAEMDHVPGVTEPENAPVESVEKSRLPDTIPLMSLKRMVAPWMGVPAVLRTAPEMR
jgi:hypothetical protein